jgi:hypothetical protein
MLGNDETTVKEYILSWDDYLEQDVVVVVHCCRAGGTSTPDGSHKAESKKSRRVAWCWLLCSCENRLWLHLPRVDTTQLLLMDSREGPRGAS